MVRLKYVGNMKRKISFVTMGKGYSFSVKPGEIISVPDVVATAAKGAAPFEAVVREKPSNNIKVVKTVIHNNEEPEEVESVIERVSVDPFVQKEIEEEVEKIEEEIDASADTDIIEAPFVEDIEEDEVEEEDVEEELSIDYTSKLKSELKDMCVARGLSNRGNRDDLIAALVNNDNGIDAEE